MSLRVEPLETPKFRVSFKTGGLNAPENAVMTTLPIQNGGNGKDEQNVIKIKKEHLLPAVTSAVALTSLGVAVYAVKAGKKSSILEELKKQEKAIQGMKDEVSSAVNTVKEELGSQIEAVKTQTSENSQKLKEQEKFFTTWLQKAEDIAVEAKNRIMGQIKESGIVKKDGHFLKMNLNSKGERIELTDSLRAELRGQAQKYITGLGVTLPLLGAGATVYMPTAESIPEKTGGLGEVPPQLAKNMKSLGAEGLIIRPVIESTSKSKFYEVGDKAVYFFKGLKDEKGNSLKHIILDKVLEFEVEVFRDGKTEKELVKAFYGDDPAMGHKRLMFSNSNYFKAKDLYEGAEAERYTFFSKCVYEFAKIKMDPASHHGYKVFNKDAFDSIKAPDAMLLNDWHTAPIAALARYKAPIEAHASELKADAAEKLKNMNLLYIVHNSDYQGTDGGHTSEILNTLFGKYALDIYEHSTTNFTCKGNQNIWSTLLTDGGVNMANMAMCLSTKVKPVSPTYANELATRPERSRALMHVSEQRLKHGTMVGQSNGWDRASNEISVDSSPLNKTIEMMNKDVVFILNSFVGSISEANLKQPEVMDKAYASFKEILATKYPDLKFELPPVRNVKPVASTMSIDEIMENRKHNKRVFVEYLKTSVQYNNAVKAYNATRKVEEHLPLMNFDMSGVSDLSDVNLDNLDNIPVLTMGVRFVDQKGVDIIEKSLVDLYKNWDQNYPNKERPIVVIGGQADDDKYRKIAQKMKNTLGEAGKRVLYMDGYTPNPAFYAGSDFTLRPSHFEPDGDKWESLYRGTPTIMTRVGGHVDSITDGKNGFLSARTISQICDAIGTQDLRVGGDGPNRDNYKESYLNAMAQDYTDAMKRGLNSFYNKESYQTLVDNAIHGDQSWVLRDEGSKIIECPLVGHLRDLGFNLSDPSLATKLADSVKNVGENK